MKLFYGDGFTEQELLSYKVILLWYLSLNKLYQRTFIYSKNLITKLYVLIAYHSWEFDVYYEWSYPSHATVEYSIW
jgi:hypothetical protein